MENKELKYLRDHIISACSLPDFIESESGINLKWNRDESGASCACPLPDHYETKPSFHVNNLDGKWVYHCFGCQKKGTIIQFVMDFLEIKSHNEAIKYLCEYYKIKDVDDLILKGLKNVSRGINFDKQIENENVLVSNQCRMLLRKDFEKNKDWVCEAYRRLNIALERKDYDEVVSVGDEAFSRLKRR